MAFRATLGDAVVAVRAITTPTRSIAAPALARPPPSSSARTLVESLVHASSPTRTVFIRPASSFVGVTGPGTAPLRAHDATRSCATSARALGRVVDGGPDHHGALAARAQAPRDGSRNKHADDTNPDTIGSPVLDALFKARAPWWWTVAKAQVQARDRSRSHDVRPSLLYARSPNHSVLILVPSIPFPPTLQTRRRRFAWHWRASPSQQAFVRAGPSAASTHDCHHSEHAVDASSGMPSFGPHGCWGSSTGSSSSSSSSRQSSRGHAHSHRRGHDPSSCAQPLSGCRARFSSSSSARCSSRSWSWLYLALNDRRRRDCVTRSGYVRHACGEWRAFVGARGWAPVGLCGRGREVLRGARDRHARRVRGLVLRHRARAGVAYGQWSGPGLGQGHGYGEGPGTAGEEAGGGGGGGGGGERAGPFDYEAFRCSQWAELLGRGPHGARHGPGHGAHGRSHAHASHQGRSGWLRRHAPQEWVRHAHRVRRRKSGVLFFTMRACDANALRLREGGVGLGAARVDARRPLARAPRSGVQFVRSPQGAGRAPLVHASMAARQALRVGAIRAFSTSHVPALPSVPPPLPLVGVCTPLELGLPLLLPLASILKSSAALHVLSFVTRISLTLLPLSARSRIIHSLRERYLRDPTSLSSSLFGRCALEHKAGLLTAPSGFLTRWNALVGLPLLVLTPLVLLALVALASLERTPITGRWRIVMLSPAEEAELVRGVLAEPASATHPAPEGTSRDWVATLRRVLDLPDEGRSLTTGRRRLLGGDVLDPRDWRVRWAEAVLRALERGATPALAEGDSAPGVRAAVLSPPPTAFPLEPRAEAIGEGAHGIWSDELVLSKPAHAHSHPRGGDGATAASQQPPLRLEYDLLVVDRPEANAFSFGFGPDARPHTQPRRGVIVVYTGFLDEILSPSSSPSASATSSAARAPPSNPLRANLAPQTLPTDAQTRQLAVLMAHELAHLALSHTLESYASSSLLVPHLARLTADGALPFAPPSSSSEDAS